MTHYCLCEWNILRDKELDDVEINKFKINDIYYHYKKTVKIDHYAPTAKAACKQAGSAWYDNRPYNQDGGQMPNST